MLTTVFGMRLRTFGIVAGVVGGIISTLCTAIFSVLPSTDDMNSFFLGVNHAVIIGVNYFWLALLVTNIVSSGMLAVGTLKKDHMFIVPWLINNGLLMPFLAFLFFVIWTFDVVHWPSDGLLSYITFLIFTVILVLCWYIFYGVYSLFKNLKADRAPKLLT